MNKWVKADIFEDISGLLEYMMGTKEFSKLKKQFYSNRSSNQN